MVYAVNATSDNSTFPVGNTFTLKVFSAYEQQSTVSVIEEAEEDEVEEKVVIDEEQAPSEEDNEGVTAFSHSSSQETNPQSSPAEMTAVPSTPSFPFK